MKKRAEAMDRGCPVIVIQVRTVRKLCIMTKKEGDVTEGKQKRQ